MAGHSKWANIRRRKEAVDAKRGKIFTKLIKEIAVAVKEGGGPDAETNPRLRMAIANAKGANMPKDNIDRAIKKASGADATAYMETTYEGYAPHGIAVFVECTTDNINRTVADVRAIFNKYNGSLSVSGSVDYMFERKSVFSLKEPENFNKDEFELELIDAGAEEVEYEDGYISITGAMEDFGSIQNFLDSKKLELDNSELQRIPTTTVKLSNEEASQVMKMIDALEDNDDVQKVYHNLEVTEEMLEG